MQRLSIHQSRLMNMRSLGYTPGMDYQKSSGLFFQGMLRVRYLPRLVVVLGLH